MKLGVFTPLFANLSFEDMLDKVQRAGLNAVEIGTGGNPGNHHCPTDELLESEEKRAAYLDELKKKELNNQCIQLPQQPDFTRSCRGKGER
jgi:sugar phosphate isomerase/epimerase